MLYVDTSALVKLLLTEPESTAVRAFLARNAPLVSSAITEVETLRVVRRQRPDLAEAARLLLDTLVLVDVGEDVRLRAATLPPPPLRTLDAIHLATALVLGPGLTAVVTYDLRMSEAAQSAGVPVVSPS